MTSPLRLEILEQMNFGVFFHLELRFSLIPKGGMREKCTQVSVTWQELCRCYQIYIKSIL